jgi:hypothetical protein
MVFPPFVCLAPSVGTILIGSGAMMTDSQNLTSVLFEPSVDRSLHDRRTDAYQIMLNMDLFKLSANRP